MKRVNDNYVLLKNKKVFYLLDKKNESVFIKCFNKVEDKGDINEILRVVYSKILNIDIPEYISIYSKSNSYEENFFNLIEESLMVSFNIDYFEITKEELKIYDYIEAMYKDYFMDYCYDIRFNEKFNKKYRLSNILNLSKEEILDFINVKYDYSEEYYKLKKYKEFLQSNFPSEKITLNHIRGNDYFHIEFKDFTIKVDYSINGCGYTCSTEYYKDIKDIVIHILDNNEENSLHEIKRLCEFYRGVNVDELIHYSEVINHLKNVNPELYKSKFEINEYNFYLDSELENRLIDVIENDYDLTFEEFSPAMYGYEKRILDYLK